MTLSAVSDARRLPEGLVRTAGVLLIAGVYGLVLFVAAEPVFVIAPAALLVGAVICIRPIIGVYIGLAAAVLFEQWGVQGLDPLTAQTHFFDNIAGYSSIDVRLSLADFLIAVTLAAAIVNKSHGVRTWHGGPVGLPVLLYVGSFAMGAIVGFVRGGWDSGAMFAELRGPIYLGALYLLTANLVRTPSQLVRVVQLFVVLVGVKALQGLWNAGVMFDSGLRLEAVTSHEDVIFFDATLVLALAAAVLRGRSRTTLILAALVPAIVVTELLTQRRVAFIALGAALSVALVCLGMVRPRLTFSIAVVAVVFVVGYVAAFWGAEGTLAQPVRAVRGMISPETLSERDRLSNYWRDIENLNIAFTLRDLPLSGVGVGQEYEFQQEPPPLTGFTYWRYMTHNAVFWIWLKGGLIGFFSFWFLVAQGVAASVRLVRQLPRKGLAMFAFAPLALLVSQVVYSSVDLGLTYSRPMIVLGVGLGLLAALALQATPIRRRAPVTQRAGRRVMAMVGTNA
jgi:hypothetical protein